MHIVNDHPREVCPHCPRDFGFVWQLLTHLDTAHSVEEAVEALVTRQEARTEARRWARR